MRDPIDLTTAQDVEKFCGLPDSAGGTDIQAGLEAYLAYPAKPLLSLGVVIGDSTDGDSDGGLKTVAERLKEAGRPFIFACEDSSEGNFVKAMQEISGASGGFAKEPAALVELLQGYKKIFTTPPEELRRQAQQATRPGATALPPSRTQQFLTSQAKRLLLGYDKKEACSFLRCTPAAARRLRLGHFDMRGAPCLPIINYSTAFSIFWSITPTCAWRKRNAQPAVRWARRGPV